MKRDSRLSGVLHLLLHMAESELPLTSDALAKLMQTNPVVVRRVLSGLRDKGLVRSEKGHGGGWRLAADLSSITLCEVYEALGQPPLFAIGNKNEKPDCLLEQAVNAALGDTLQQAEDMLLTSFSTITLAALRTDFEHRLDQNQTQNEYERTDGSS